MDNALDLRPKDREFDSCSSKYFFPKGGESDFFLIFKELFIYAGVLHLSFCRVLILAYRALLTKRIQNASGADKSGGYN